MGDMLVAYEDDVPKDRGLKVSGHCALDSGLGCANTFAPYCISFAYLIRDGSELLDKSILHNNKYITYRTPEQGRLG